MGPRYAKTNIPIDHLFDTPYPPPHKGTIKLVLKWRDDCPPATYLLSHQTCRDLGGSVPDDTRTIQFSPKSHLRCVDTDFDIDRPGSIRIDRADGIAIVIIEALNLFVKFYMAHDGASKDGQKSIKATCLRGWDHSILSERMLSDHLSMGYDILYLRGVGLSPVHLCEAMDERDSRNQCHTDLLRPDTIIASASMDAPTAHPPPVSMEANEDQRKRKRPEDDVESLTAEEAAAITVRSNLHIMNDALRTCFKEIREAAVGKRSRIDMKRAQLFNNMDAVDAFAAQALANRLRDMHYTVDVYESRISVSWGKHVSVAYATIGHEEDAEQAAQQQQPQQASKADEPQPQVNTADESHNAA